MHIEKNINLPNRFNIAGIKDKGFETKKGQKIEGVVGYDGLIGKIITLFLKAFNKVVTLQGDDGLKYNLNCESLNNWAKRNGIGGEDFYKHIHDPKWIENTLKNYRQHERRQKPHQDERPFQDNQEGEKPFQDNSKQQKKDQPKEIPQVQNEIKIAEKIPQRFPISNEIDTYSITRKEEASNAAQEILQRIAEEKFTPERLFQSKEAIRKVVSVFEKLSKEIFNDKIRIQIISKDKFPYASTDSMVKGYREALESGCYFFTGHQANTGWGSRKENIFALTEDFLKQWKDASEIEKESICQKVFYQMEKAVDNLSPSPLFKIPPQAQEPEKPQQKPFVRFDEPKDEKEFASKPVVQEPPKAQPLKQPTFNFGGYEIEEEPAVKPVFQEPPKGEPSIQEPIFKFGEPKKQEPPKAEPAVQKLINDELKIEDQKVENPLVKKKIDPYTILDSEIIELDFSTVEMDGDLFNELFGTSGNYSSAKRLLPKLSKENIYILARYFSEEHWKCLEKAQILALDFSKIEMDEGKFQVMVDTIFSTKGNSVFDTKAYNLIPKLTSEKIYKLAPFFSKEQWKNVIKSQTLDLDFSKIKMDKPKFQTMVDELFNTSGTLGSTKAYERIPGLTSENIYILAPYFEKEHWKWVTKTKILTLDFSKIQMDELKFQIMMDELFNTSGAAGRNNASERIPELTSEHIYSLAPYFSKEQWEWVTKTKVLKLDFSKIKMDKLKFQSMVDALFSISGGWNSNASQRIQDLTSEQIYSLGPFFSKEQWDYVIRFQIVELDFSKFDMEKPKFKAMIDSLFSIDAGFNKAMDRLPHLKEDQKEIIKPYLSDDAKAYLK